MKKPETKHFTVKSTEEAWNVANQIFPTDYAEDEGSRERAGYPIYRSTADGHYYDYICDLTARLEINLSDGSTVNIWIEEDEEAEAANEAKTTTEDKPEEERQYFMVSFKYAEDVYCSNVAHAVAREDVEREYSCYAWSSVREAKPYEVEEARRKGMPFVEVEHMKPEAVAEAEEAAARAADAQEAGKNGFPTADAPEAVERFTFALNHETYAPEAERRTAEAIISGDSFRQSCLVGDFVTAYLNAHGFPWGSVEMHGTPFKVPHGNGGERYHVIISALVSRRIDEGRRWKSTEGETVTEAQLRRELQEMQTNGELPEELDFETYVKCCEGRNGNLSRIA